MPSALPRSTVFCQRNPGQCEYNRFVKSLMYDFRQSRDTVNNPHGTHNVVTPGYNKLDVCEMPVQLFYADKRIWQHLGQWLGAQHEGLVGCQTPCIITPNKSDADVLVGMSDPPFEGKEWWQRTAAILLDAHSMHPSALAASDMLVGFHRQADVHVSHLHALSRATPCSHTTTAAQPPAAAAEEAGLPHCLSPAIEQRLRDAEREKTEAASAAAPTTLRQVSASTIIGNREGGARESAGEARGRARGRARGTGRARGRARANAKERGEEGTRARGRERGQETRQREQAGGRGADVWRVYPAQEQGGNLARLGLLAPRGIRARAHRRH
jgi:hypothetical protein